MPAANAVTRKLILASASPRRREILQAAGFEFDVVETAVPETQREGESAEQFVRRLATEKAEAAWNQIEPSCAVPILGADTVVVLEDQTLGKPASPEEARRMLRLLSGRQHRGPPRPCLLFPPSAGPRSELRKDIQVASTIVQFSKLAEEEIEDYVASGEPLDKAGAYGIQGLASKHIEWIAGCYFNVVGLPISLVYRMLKKASCAASDV